ncbi:hypothetical protein AAG906_007451 [Vitis piasezkii]
MNPNRAGGGSRDKEMDKNRCVDRIDRCPGGRPVRRAENLKSLPRLSFSPISSGSSTLVPLLRGTDWIVEARVLDFGTQGCAFGRFPPQLARQSLRQSASSRAQGKRPAEPSQPDQSEARRKARKVVPGRSINFSQLKYFGFEEIFGRMRWLPVVTISEPIFPTLIRTFYSRVTYGVGGPITSTVRGVEITLSPESICRIFDIPSVGLRVYESKVYVGFEPKEGMGKPSAHSLTVISRILHHMVCSIQLPRGGHRDEVSYLEAFIVDSILTGRRIHVEQDRVLPYGHFLTRVFKDVGVDLSRETDFEALTTYDTYDELWADEGRMHPGDEEEAEIQEMEGGLDPRRDFEQSMHECNIPSPKYHFGTSRTDHAPLMDLSAQISSLGTRMEELAVVNDTRFHSMEDRIDEYQTDFTSQFEHLDRRLGRLEEMMAYLRSMFPPPRLDIFETPSLRFFMMLPRGEILGSRGHTHA